MLVLYIFVLQPWAHMVYKFVFLVTSNLNGTYPKVDIFNKV